MLYPTLRPLSEKRQTVNTFLGLDRNPQAPEGTFYDMENLTSDFFPVLAPRKSRPLYADTNCLGIIGGNVLQVSDNNTHPSVELCYVDALSLRMVVGKETTNLSMKFLSHKWLVSMGAYVLVFPDKKYINTLDTSDYGNMEAIWSATEAVELTSCDEEGSEGEGCVKLACANIGADFAPGDGVTVSGLTQAKHLNGAALIRKVSQDFLIIDGVLDQPVTQPLLENDPVTVARTVPDMDFVVECGNRLWGCRYGVDEDGNVINQIYCCKLGDFKNWNVFQGLASDAWAASVGSDGPFTGGISYMGNPLFFKENCLHKVYISATGAHQIVDTVCRGVQLHCGKSLAVVGETLYYKAVDGVMAYDGAFPRPIGDALGQYRYCGRHSTPVSMHNGQYICAVGGSSGSKYYLSMNDDSGQFHLFVYDTRRDLWHREDKLHILHACSLGTKLYGVTASGDILLLSGDSADNTPVSWYAVTGDLGLDIPDKKYISRLTLRLMLTPGSQVSVDAQYDHSGIWQPLCTLYGDRLGSFPVTVQPRRCDHLRLRLRGCGDMKLYSLTKQLAEGSDEN